MRRSAFSVTVTVLLATLSLSAAEEGGLNPLSGLDLESLEATRSLPLFTPSRTPPLVPEPEPVEVVAAPEPAAAPPPPSPPPLELIGVIMTDSAKIALLRDKSTGEIVRLSSSDDYDGWSIRFVDSRTVELHSADRTETLKMFDKFEAVSEADGFGVGREDFLPDFTGAVNVPTDDPSEGAGDPEPPFGEQP